jgi:hypothetical protein
MSIEKGMRAQAEPHETGLGISEDITGSRVTMNRDIATQIQMAARISRWDCTLMCCAMRDAISSQDKARACIRLAEHEETCGSQPMASMS